MGKFKLFKRLFLYGMAISLFTLIGISNDITPHAQQNYERIYALGSSSVYSNSRVVVNDYALNAKLRTMLNKNATENLFSEDFLNNPNFAQSVENEGTADELITIPTYQLDFSNCGITDIRELVQFELPTNIMGINLCGNNITNDDLTKIIQLLDCEKGSTLEINGVEYESQTDFSTQIKKVNLNNNNINLDTAPLSDTRLIFGVQNMPSPSVEMFKVGEYNPQFYIRENVDENFLTFSFQHELSTNIGKKIFSNIPYNQVVSLIDDNPSNYKTNKYYISIQSMPESDTAYFKDYTYSHEFILYDISINSTFTVERKTLLDLKVSNEGKLLSGSPIIVEGFASSDQITIFYENASTQDLSSPTHTNKVWITITLNATGYEHTSAIEFIVVDTIKPIIKLIGSAHTYSSINKEFVDPGVIAYDPTSSNSTTGDDLTARVMSTNNIDVTTLGQYTITYTVSDDAGNTTTITRIVEIQERALTKLSLRCNTVDIKDGEDVTLSVQLEGGVDASQYSSIKYYWYLDDKLFMTTVSSDKVNGLSTITILGNSKKTQNIYVRCEATQSVDGAIIEVYSDTIPVAVNTSLSSTNSVILAVSCAVLIIILTIAIITLVKYKKSHRKTHTKHKNFHKNKQPSGGGNSNLHSDIQIVKDYRGSTTPPNGGGSSNGGGNSNKTDTPNSQETPTLPQNTNDKTINNGITSTPKDNSKFDPNDYR